MADLPWQVYAQNGEQRPGVAAMPDEFDRDEKLIVASAHVWMWRRVEDGLEILVQKRAAHLFRRPGYLDISAAGHIDTAETPVECIVREAREELGVSIDTEKLCYVCAIRKPSTFREIDTVYIYQVDEMSEFSFADGEVAETSWVDIATFREMTREPEKYKLSDHGEEYFGLLIKAVERFV